MSRMKNQPSTFRVVVRDIESVSINGVDFGWWIVTDNAAYKLHNPCNIRVHRGLSQADIHLPHRALLGLISNFRDMLNETSAYIGGKRFIDCLQDMTASEIYKHNSNCPSLFNAPFDLMLLKREADSVLDNILPLFDNRECVLLRDLRRMASEWGKHSRHMTNWGMELEEFDYLASATESERRSNRKPCGCSTNVDCGRAERGGDVNTPRFNRGLEQHLARITNMNP